ncbi:kinase-like protein [Rhizophagus irregularis]|nr:kinase-like protein [Rhizophagus irregularis]
MSKDAKVKDLNYYIDWLERSITEEHIELYEYSDFKNIQLIGSGAYGNVYRVNRKYSNRIFALKSFNYEKQTLKEVVKELKLHRSVNYHENIIRLYGITRVEIDTIQKYSFVLEYADSGTLNTYLNENFNKLDWNDKYNLASQFASAIEFLHEKDTIHRDLHGNNILIHQKNIKLADFGLSKKIAEASSNTSKILGVMPYIDPKKLENQNYKLNKKSDVYSIGVLLWQISSGYKPFYELDHDGGLVLAILNGKREEIINGTPVKYSNLYRECWKYEPNERPNIQKIVSTLKSITSLEEINTTMINNFIEKKENHLLEIYEANSELSKETLDLNIELMSDNELNLVEYNTKSNERVNSESKINDSEKTDQLISHKIPKSSKVRQESLIDNSDYYSSSTDVTEAIKAVVNNTIQNQNYENSLLSASSDQVTRMSIDLIEFINVDSLIAFLIEKHDRGITFEQIQQLISKQILKTNQATDQKNSSIKAFELFSKAANDNYSIAQVYLAKCYYDGYGTENNCYLAFYWYQKSVENGSIIGQFYLGNCYEFGIGTEENEKKSVYFYKEAARNGNVIARLYLANCYRLGKGIEKNEIKAFKYYETLAKQEISDAQLRLGDCYYYGIGTKIDKIQAKCWYEKATNNGNIIAKNILKRNYNMKTGVEIDKSKKIKFYKILFNKNLSQLGSYYFGKLLLKTNYEKSFYYFQKAAENGCKFAQFNLGGCYQLGDGVMKDLRKSFELYKKSAEQGYINAQSQLIYCYTFGYGTEIDRVKAFELAKTIAEKGYGDVQYLLGQYYIHGEGVNKDGKKAFELFRKSFKKNIKYLSSNKENMINEKKDFEYSKLFAKI